MLMRILLIRLDIFAERVYREEKKYHRLNKLAYCRTNEGKKDKTDSFQSINEESMVQPQVIADTCTHV